MWSLLFHTCPFSVLVKCTKSLALCSDFLLPVDIPITSVFDLIVASICQSHTRRAAHQDEIHSGLRPLTPCSVRSWRISRSQGSVLSPYWHQGKLLKSQQRRWQKAQTAAQPPCPSVRIPLRRICKKVSLKERPVGAESTFTLWQRAFANWFSPRWVLALFRFYWHSENCKITVF